MFSSTRKTRPADAHCDIGRSSLGNTSAEAVQRPLAPFAHRFGRDAQPIGGLCRALTNDDDSDDQVGMSADLLAKTIVKKTGFLVRIVGRRNAESRWAWPADKFEIDAMSGFDFILVLGKLDQPASLFAGAAQHAAHVPLGVAQEGCGNAADARQIGAMDCMGELDGDLCDDIIVRIPKMPP